jgi:hypothetical protein
MVGTPIEVRQPLVALKISGSSRDATCLTSHVTTGVVESQTMNRSDVFTVSFEDDHLPGRLALAHSIEGIVDLMELDT